MHYLIMIIVRFDIRTIALRVPANQKRSRWVPRQISTEKFPWEELGAAERHAHPGLLEVRFRFADQPAASCAFKVQVQ
jgi:hypothetical protein